MILIVDDDANFAEHCSMLLTGYGYEVQVAGSGHQALDKIGFQYLDLLISDCSMPGMGGIELSRRVKALVTTCMTPILLMSGSRESDLRGCGSYDAFMRKPFLAEELLHKVRTLVPNYTH